MTTVFSVVACVFADGAAVGADLTQPAGVAGKAAQACRAAVVAQYASRPGDVAMADLSRDPDFGGYMIEGTVDLGDQGVKSFRCRFDEDRQLKDVMATTPDGE